ncbi:MAG: signal peptidase I [Bacteroidia bacterium]|nr:signal peptidase I [Bacteroidia bacterium]
MKKYKRCLKWSLWTLLILLLMRVFFYQVASVPDFHMASTLLPGDRVIVNKYRAGLRLPISIIGLPGVNAPYADGIRLPYLRLPALKKLRRQEVVVFNYPSGSDKPIDRKRHMISRIIGLPTDTVMIKDKEVSVNNKTVIPPAFARSEYRIVTSGQSIDNEFLRKYGIEKPRMVANIGIFDVDLPKDASSTLEKTKGIKTVRETKQFLGDASSDYYPLSNFFMWNRDQFGPFRVPAKGMTVAIDVKSIDFYRDMIETQEGHDVMIDFRGVHIDEKIVTSYTFEKDYYFVLSDNRDNPDDSRKIGFVPADHIIGVAKRILWSGQNKYDYIRKFHFGRIFKGIRQ